MEMCYWAGASVSSCYRRPHAQYEGQRHSELDYDSKLHYDTRSQGEGKGTNMIRFPLLCIPYPMRIFFLIFGCLHLMEAISQLVFDFSFPINVSR